MNVYTINADIEIKRSAIGNNGNFKNGKTSRRYSPLSRFKVQEVVIR